MNFLKLISITIGLLVLSLSLGFSQTDERPLDEAEIIELQKTMKANTVSLQLTEEQKSVYKVIAEKYGKELMTLRESDTSKFSKYRKMKSIKKSRNKEMKSVLSEEQYKRYLQNDEAMEKQMREYMKN